MGCIAIGRVRQSATHNHRPVALVARFVTKLAVVAIAGLFAGLGVGQRADFLRRIVAVAVFDFEHVFGHGQNPTDSEADIPATTTTAKTTITTPKTTISTS
jgi:hypothetical protein